MLTWDKATDNQTSQNGLSYNIRIGKTSGSGDIVNPMASVIDGFRKIQTIGNANQSNSYTINNLADGNYYWSVQAIDNAFAGGAWASERSFFISTTGVKDIPLKGNISIYPNPAKDFIEITRNELQPCMVTIFDLNGKNILKQLLKSNEQIVHLNNLASGFYIVKLQTINGIAVNKLAIE